jgi:2-polyprenyl-3-methyl-5-hydroxy-6-metoxy-1,4-benzoquinol methylase
MNQIETDLKLLDVGSDVDVETLMARIRQHVNGNENTAVALSNASARSNDNALGESLASQAEFNRALVETLTRFSLELQQHVASLNARQAELQTEQAHLSEQLLELRHDFVQFSDEEPLRRREIISHFENESRRFAEKLAGMEQQSSTARQVMEAQLAPWFGALGSLGAQMEANTSSLSELEHSIEERLELLHLRVRRAERTRSLERAAGTDKADGERAPILSAAVTSFVTRLFQPEKKRAAAALVLNGKPLAPPVDYFMFEHEFRGARSEIKQRQLAYLDLFRGRENVLDLGCGRGEFVELISEQGIPVVGVDQDEDMVVECCERGLRVVRADVFDYLRTIPDASVDGIFAAQLVEHLTPDRVLALLQFCNAKLKAGGVIVLETVNPHCSLALGNFYLDPTRVRPIPPKLLAFMLTQSAFVLQTFQFSSPVPESGRSATLSLTTDSDARVHVYQDYAVIAVRK